MRDSGDTNTTLFDGADPNTFRGAILDEMMVAGRGEHDALSGIHLRQGARPEALLGRARSKKLFRAILSNRKKSWRFNASPIFMEFLRARRTILARRGECHVSAFSDGKNLLSAAGRLRRQFQELMETVEWYNYGTESRQPKMRQLHGALGLWRRAEMNYTFGSIKGAGSDAKAIFYSSIATPRRCNRSTTGNDPRSRNHLGAGVSIKGRRHMRPCRRNEYGHGNFKSRRKSIPTNWRPPRATSMNTSRGGFPISRTNSRYAKHWKGFRLRGNITFTLKDGRKVEGYVSIGDLHFVAEFIGESFPSAINQR